MNRLSPASLLLLPLLLLLAPVSQVAGQYNDARCKCICPSPQVVTPNETHATTSGQNQDNHSSQEHGSSGEKRPERSIYIGNVERESCNCDGVVLPKLTPDVQGRAKEFCPWCECKYESRNTTTIKWTVSLVISLVVILVVYMIYLNLFDPSMRKGMTLSCCCYSCR